MAYLFVISIVGLKLLSVFCCKTLVPFNSELNVYLNDSEYFKHLVIVNEFYKARENWKTSNLGTLLFKNNDIDKASRLAFSKNKRFMIFIWNSNDVVTQAGLDPKKRKQIIRNCSVRNCIFTCNPENLAKSDAVIVNVHSGILPKVKGRNPRQKWVMYDVEAPTHAFVFHKHYNMARKYQNVFNWTMNYRTDSDVPIPYGRIVPLTRPINLNLNNEDRALKTLVPYWKDKKKDVLAVVMMSKCIFRNRILFLAKLKRHMPVDVIGKCSTDTKLRNICPGHYHKACPALRQYLFYLVFENSNCQQYLTEKVFFNAYEQGAIPVVYGTPLKDCVKLLPPKSFLHFDRYKSHEHLAKAMREIARNKKKQLLYHNWRRHFKVLNEHGFFGVTSKHICRLCEALNYNDAVVRVYNYSDLKNILDPNLSCADEIKALKAREV